MFDHEQTKLRLKTTLLPTCLACTRGQHAGGGGHGLYRVTLHLDDGTTRTFTQNTRFAFQIDDRVSMQKA